MFCNDSNKSLRNSNIILKKGFAFLIFLSVAFSVLLLTRMDLKIHRQFRIQLLSVNNIPFLVLPQSRKNKSHQSNTKGNIVTCHYIDTSDDLSPIAQNSSFPLKSIFFHETSCREQLNSRQACSVESAAKAHPHWQINVLFSGPVKNENLNINGSLNTLKQFTNVKFFRLHLLQYVKGTPVENFVKKGVFNRSLWPIQHTSDLLRLVTLSKWGGVYLDLDQVVVKSFENLGTNWVVREHYTSLAGCPLSISKDPLGKSVIDEALSAFKTHYRENLWSQGSTHVITAVLKKICNVKNINLMSARRCRGFKVFKKELFFPVGFSNARQYLGQKDIQVGNPYAHHMYNKVTAQYEITNKSVYARLAQKYCPTIHKLYGDQFGK